MLRSKSLASFLTSQPGPSLHWSRRQQKSKAKGSFPSWGSSSSPTAFKIFVLHEDRTLWKWENLNHTSDTASHCSCECTLPRVGTLEERGNSQQASHGNQVLQKSYSIPQSSEMVGSGTPICPLDFQSQFKHLCLQPKRPTKPVAVLPYYNKIQ